MINLIDLFLKKSSCNHTHALINTNEGYCPDCGAYLKKYFYIVRCACCEVKREAKMYFGEVMPKEKFCTNCGAKEFYVEKLEVISFIDIPYAIHTKEQITPVQDELASAQIWVEGEKTKPVKFLTGSA